MSIGDNLIKSMNEALEYEKSINMYANLSEEYGYYVSPDAQIIHLCPHCGESYYAERYSTTTALAWTPVYKDGMLMNENPNTTTTYCRCLNCGKDFSYKT